MWQVPENIHTPHRRHFGLNPPPHPPGISSLAPYSFKTPSPSDFPMMFFWVGMDIFLELCNFKNRYVNEPKGDLACIICNSPL